MRAARTSNVARDPPFAMGAQMARTVLLLGVVVVVSGCVTAGAIDRGVASLSGQSLDQVMARIGPPDAKDQQDDETYLVWTSTRSQTSGLPPTTPSNGRIEAQTRGAPQLVRHECRVTLGFDRDDRVSSYRWQGDTRGCGRYAKLTS